MLRKPSMKDLHLSKETSISGHKKGRIQIKVLSCRTGRKKILELEEVSGWADSRKHQRTKIP